MSPSWGLPARTKYYGTTSGTVKWFNAEKGFGFIALVVTDRRRKRKKKVLPAAQLPAAEPERRIPPSTTATADEQPGGAN
ncbi:cold-shock protein [Streptomyces sp. NPDC003758]